MFSAKNRILLSLFAFLFFAFLLLGIAVKFFGGFLLFDPLILVNIHEVLPDSQVRFWVFITNFGNSSSLYYSAFGLALVFWVFKRKREAIYLTISIVGSQNLNVLVKNIWQRPRPQLWHFDYYPTPQDFSFPSGHSMGSINFALTLLIILWGISNKRLKILLSLMATIYVVLVSFSRLYLGVHYPTDILGGWLLGSSWTMAMAFLFNLPNSPNSTLENSGKRAQNFDKTSI
ncbi:MAG: phosphatase PAP2 family protein [Geminocystis sp.]|nr:phosphatase PAP2 family protein [Geminocystis sp.]HIK37928.1 phosphatase PAP2 family protein [Geminocystis sp. M7585_C2015_104]MCS7147068.1 phosphatase PAP2 family protein [Geminocystis sp.]MCX8079284.1 phosphatase PAP2 family protein [Geminocystis sp.]MDW8115891.1 phosphatase PAP2 family protein [Geminocystis sp.]